MGESYRSCEWSANGRRQTFSACGLPGDGRQPVTGCVGGARDAGRHHEKVVADAEGAASEGGHDSVGPGATHTALAGAIRPPQPVIQERSKLRDMDIMLQNWLPVGAVTEEDVSSSESLSESLEGCFSCGVLTHTTDQCQTLVESFQFLPTGWQAVHIGDKFILRPGLAGPPSQQMGNAD